MCVCLKIDPVKTCMGVLLCHTQSEQSSCLDRAPSLSISVPACICVCELINYVIVDDWDFEHLDMVIIQFLRDDSIWTGPKSERVRVHY